MNRDTPAIGVLMWLNQDFARRVLSGVLQYTESRNFREVKLFDCAGFNLSQATDAGLDGIISVLDYNQGVGRRFPFPHVRVPRLSADRRELSVTTDARLTGRMAAEHLLSLRIPNLASIPGADPAAFKELEQGFAATVSVTDANLVPGPRTPQDHVVTEWLTHAPRPIALLCQNDGLARRMASLCLNAGFRIPGDAAILGIENDTIVCMRSHPTLSSVTVPAERIGTLAAEHLHKCILQQTVESAMLPPSGMILRESTNTLAVRDPVVAVAVQFIRARFNQPLTSTMISGHVGLSRRTLEYRFREIMNCSIHEEIVRCRIEKATTMLAANELTVKEVAVASGFTNLAHFNRFIRKHTGLSPRAYRDGSAAALSNRSSQPTSTHPERE